MGCRSFVLTWLSHHRRFCTRHTLGSWCPIPYRLPLIASFMGPTWGSTGADRTQVGPMLAPRTLLSGTLFTCKRYSLNLHEILFLVAKILICRIKQSDVRSVIPLYCIHNNYIHNGYPIPGKGCLGTEAGPCGLRIIKIPSYQFSNYHTGNGNGRSFYIEPAHRYMQEILIRNGGDASLWPSFNPASLPVHGI